VWGAVAHLGQDVTTHFQFISRLATTKYQREDKTPDGNTARVQLALQGIMMLSDIGHAVLSFPLHVKWSELVREEFFRYASHLHA